MKIAKRARFILLTTIIFSKSVFAECKERKDWVQVLATPITEQQKKDLKERYKNACRDENHKPVDVKQEKDNVYIVCECK